MPGAELVVLEDAGELIELEQPDQYFDIVSAFIAKHDSRQTRPDTERAQASDGHAASAQANLAASASPSPA